MRFKPPVFVVGSPRSGTTWLYHLSPSIGQRPECLTCWLPVFDDFGNARIVSAFSRNGSRVSSSSAPGLKQKRYPPGFSKNADLPGTSCEP